MTVNHISYMIPENTMNIMKHFYQVAESKKTQADLHIVKNREAKRIHKVTRRISQLMHL